MNGERRIIILDTTLRDGSQSPGFDMTRSDKVIMAGCLEKLGVDIIEAGFPASSQGQFDDVRAVTDTLTKSAVSVMARANADDIKKAGLAVRDAREKYIHTSISTSPIHRKFKLRKSRSVILDMAVDAVLCALEYTDHVEIGAEDATRTEFEFLSEFCTMVTDAGAEVVNIADTVGYIQPQEFYNMIKRLCHDVAAFRDGKARVSVHCHNDLGSATANTLAGIVAGAAQAEVTLLGAGERAGNAPMEEIVIALNARSDYFNGISTGINASYFAETARKFTSITGIPVSPVKPVAGRNVYRHASGIHQKGMIASSLTYSIIPASHFGYNPRVILLSRHSGLGGVMSELKELSAVSGGDIDDGKLLEKFKTFADDKPGFNTTDVITFLNESEIIASQVWSLVACSYVFRSNGAQKMRIKAEFLSSDGIRKRKSAKGDGKWDTVLMLLLSVFNLDIELLEYSLSGAGISGRCTERGYLVLRYEGEEYSAESAGSDSVLIMAECFISIINRITAKLQIVLR